VGFFQKIEFTSKEIVEENQLRISIDDLVGSLLERQPDVQSEAVLTAGASLGRTHDSVSATGDDHVPEIAHARRERLGRLKFRRYRSGSS